MGKKKQAQIIISHLLYRLMHSMVPISIHTSTTIPAGGAMYSNSFLFFSSWFSPEEVLLGRRFVVALVDEVMVKLVVTTRGGEEMLVAGE